MGIVIGVLILAGLGLMAYVRLAPSDPAVWNVDPRAGLPVVGETVLPPPGAAPVIATTLNAATALLAVAGSPEAVLARLDAIAMAAPGTTRLAGSVAEGRITWVSRSAFFGFPDYITASATGTDSGAEVILYARARFGQSDLGVNAARLKDWLSRL